jgi:hypothetical protein
MRWPDRENFIIKVVGMCIYMYVCACACTREIPLRSVQSLIRKLKFSNLSAPAILPENMIVHSLTYRRNG